MTVLIACVLIAAPFAALRIADARARLHRLRADVEFTHHCALSVDYDRTVSRGADRPDPVELELRQIIERSQG